jgi:Cu(I)/Ag(I) efflux system membrane fusion protein
MRPTDSFVVGSLKRLLLKQNKQRNKFTGNCYYDPNSAVNIAAGRINVRRINLKKMNKGQKLFDLYSPELLTEQKLYLFDNQ